MRIGFERPQDPWSAAALHLPLAVASGIALLAGALLKPTQIPMIPCWFLNLFNRPCPFCGSTRSFCAAVKGDWLWSVQQSPLGFAAFALTAATFVISLVALGTRRRLDVSLSRNEGRIAILAAALCVAASWIYRWSTGLR